jgi:hypothetical protein
MRDGEVGTEIAPLISATSDDSELIQRIDALLRRTLDALRAARERA